MSFGVKLLCIAAVLSISFMGVLGQWEDLENSAQGVLTSAYGCAKEAGCHNGIT